MKPICVPCERFMRAKKTGYYFTEGMPGADWDKKRGKPSIGWIPYKIWIGDLYECPDCKTQIITDVGLNAVVEHYEKDFVEFMLSTNANQLLVKDC